MSSSIITTVKYNLFNMSKFYHKKFFLIILIILIADLLFYIPVLLNPNLVLERGNDLQEQFWPAFYFIKQQILVNHQFPLWNNLWFSGMPLLQDPQLSFFYLPNIIFLLFPIGSTFIITFLLHIFWGALGIYFISRKILKLSEISSLFTVLLFIFSPKLAGFLEAGHPGLIESYSWIPYVIMGTLMLAKSHQKIWILLLSISLSAIFFTHTIIFLIALTSSLILYTICILPHIKQFKSFLISLSFAFGFMAITLLPQLEWSKLTTRFLLLSIRDVYPKWNSIEEFLKNIFIPWINGTEIWKIDSEKWIPIGLIVSILSIFGFLGLKRKIKLIILTTVTLITISVLNNISPLNRLLITQDWYVLMRVSTRLWFIILFIIIFLAGLGLDRIISKFNSKVAYLIIILSIVELISFSWFYLIKPTEKLELAPESIYQFLENDPEKFRVFCTTKCLSQKKSAEYGLELIEGYNTIQQINYYKQAWQLMGGYWNYYTLSIPPMGIYNFEQLQPDPVSLGAYNVKYIISTHKLTNTEFIFKKRFGDYLIYQNNMFLPRAYFWTDDQKPSAKAPINYYSPNHIQVNTSSHQTQRIVLSEVYSPGWVAYLNGKSKVTVQQKPDALRLVDIKSDTQFVDFKYQPESFKYGLIITTITLIFMGIFIAKH